MLLLNTDLHVAELAVRMSRAQFVRNTLGAVQMQVHPERYASTPDLTSDDSSSLRAPAGGAGARSPKRSGSSASWSSVGRDVPLDEGAGSSASVPSAGASSAQGSQPQSPVRSPTLNPAAYDKNWELEMEAMLKVRSRLFRDRGPVTDSK
jgi:PH and SEC7 domain-containing protein